jgi:hypothetical protein
MMQITIMLMNIVLNLGAKQKKLTIKYVLAFVLALLAAKLLSNVKG